MTCLACASSSLCNVSVRTPSSKLASKTGKGIVVKSSIVAIFLGGMGGNYFYGGIGLLTVLLVFAEATTLNDLAPVKVKNVTNPSNPSQIY